VEPWERLFVSRNERVKVLSPEIAIITRDQGFYCLEVFSGIYDKVSIWSTCRGLSPQRANELFIVELGRTISFLIEAVNKLKRRGDSMAIW